jgi:hypothetical protein
VGGGHPHYGPPPRSQTKPSDLTPAQAEFSAPADVATQQRRRDQTPTGHRASRRRPHFCAGPPQEFLNGLINEYSQAT